MAKSSQHTSQSTSKPYISDTLLLGASLIGAPTGESISRVSQAAGISLVREMGRLTPCALLERAGIRRTRRNKLALGLAFLTSSSMLIWIAL